MSDKKYKYNGKEYDYSDLQSKYGNRVDEAINKFGFEEITPEPKYSYNNKEYSLSDLKNKYGDRTDEAIEKFGFKEIGAKKKDSSDFSVLEQNSGAVSENGSLESSQYKEGSAFWNQEKIKSNNPEITRLFDDYQAAKTVSDDRKKEITQSVDDEINQSGVWNNIKDYGKRALNFMIDTSLAGVPKDKRSGIREKLHLETNPLSDELKQVNEEYKQIVSQAKADNKPIPIITDEQKLERARDLKIEKQINSQSESQVRSFLKDSESKVDEFGMSDKDKLNLFQYSELASLSEKDKLNLAQQNIQRAEINNLSKELKSLAEKARKTELSEEEKNQGIASYQRYNEVVEEAKNTYEEFISNKDDIGNAKDNIDLLKRNYGWLRNFADNAGATGLDLTAGLVDAREWIANATGTNNPLLSYRIRETSKLLRETSGDTREGIAKPISVEDINTLSDFGQWFWNTAVASQVPIYAAVATGGIGLGALGVSATGTQYQEMTNDESDYNYWQKTLVPLGYGASETLSAYVDRMVMMNAGRIMRSATEPERRVIAKGMWEKAKEASKLGLEVAKNATYEGVDEAATEIMQNLMDIYALDKKDVGVFDNVLDASAAGAVMGAAFPFLGAIAGRTMKPFSLDNRLGKINKEILSFEEALKNQDLSENERKIIENQLVKANQKNLGLILEEAKNISEFSPEQFQALKTIERTQADLQNQAKEILASPNMEQSMKDQIVGNLKAEFEAVENNRIGIINGNANDLLGLLEQDEVIRLKEEASKELIQEKNPNGDKSVRIEDAEISQRAWENYKKENLLNETAQAENINDDGDIRSGVNPLDSVEGEQNNQTDEGGEIQSLQSSDNIQRPQVVKASENGKEYTISQSEGGKIFFTDKDGKAPSERTSKRLALEYAKQVDLTEGKRADESVDARDVEGMESASEQSKFVAENSQNPVEIAESILNNEIENYRDELDYKQRVIAENLGHVSRESFIQNSDETHVKENGSIPIQYLRKNGTPLDTKAKELSEIAGVEITEQDLVDFILDNPSGTQTFLNNGFHTDISNLKARFEEVTGLPATNEILQEVINQNDIKSERLNNSASLDFMSDEYFINLQNEIEQYEQETNNSKIDTSREEISSVENGSKNDRQSGNIQNGSGKNQGVESQGIERLQGQRQESTRIHQEIQDYENRLGERIRETESQRKRPLDRHEREDVEKQTAFDYAQENNLWTDDLHTLGEIGLKGGNENTLVLDKENGVVYKSNNLLNSQNSISQFFEGIDGHNEIFPNSKYSFVGFTGMEGNKNRTPYVEPIVKQDYIPNAEQANQSEIDAYMASKGFEKINDHTFKNEEYTVSDLRPRNVLKDPEGNIHVIDDIVRKNNPAQTKDNPTDNKAENVSEKTTISKPIFRKLVQVFQGFFGTGNVHSDSEKLKKILNSNPNNVFFQEQWENQKERESIISQAKSDGTYLKAPNGKETNLNEKQWVDVRTKQFKEWFGDWENDAENASKVVDKNGEPMVVYHGTNTIFTEFKRSESKGTHGESDQLEGIYFADNIEAAEWFTDTGNIVPAFLNIKNPYQSERVKTLKEEQNSDSAKGVSQKIEKQGFDGILLDVGFVARGEQKLYLAFNPNQIKSATDNVGTFFENSNDIRFMQTPNGTIWGATYLNEKGEREIYINEERLSPETLLHEVYHPFDDMMKQAADKQEDVHAMVAIAKLDKLAKENGYLEKVQNNPAYQNKTLEEQQSEARVQMIGEIGNKQLDKTFYEKLQSAVKDAIRWMAKQFGISLKGYSPEQIMNLSLDDIVKASLASAHKGEFKNENTSPISIKESVMSELESGKINIDDVIARESEVLSNYNDVYGKDSNQVSEQKKVVESLKQFKSESSKPKVQFSISSKVKDSFDKLNNKINKSIGRDLTLSLESSTKANNEIISKVKKLWNNTFKSSAGLSSFNKQNVDFFEIIKGLERSESSVIDGLKYETKQFKLILSKIGNKDALKVKNAKLRLVNDYMSGMDVDLAFLDTETISQIDFFRSRIDNLSNNIIEVLLKKASTLEDSLSKQNEDSLSSDRIKESIINVYKIVEKIEDNKGKYITRSYQAFLDNKYIDRLTVSKSNMSEVNRKKIDKAVEYLINEEGLSKKESEANIYEYLDSIKKGFDSKGYASSNNGAAKAPFLKKRKDLPKEFRELLGEVQEPLYNYVNTVYGMSNYLASLTYQEKLLEGLIESGVGSYESTSGYTKLSSNSENWSVLSDLYVPNGFAQALNDIQPEGRIKEDWARALVGLTAIAKVGKTVWSPTTTARNVLSGVFLGINSGHLTYNAKYVSKALNQAFSAKSVFTEVNAKQLRAELIEQGVINDGVNSGELRATLNDFKRNIDRLVKTNPLEKSAEAVQTLYAFGDDFYKVVGYLTEKQRFIKSGMSETEAATKAGYRIRGGYPTYSYLSPMMKKLRRFPLMGTFVSFPYETVRSTKNNAMYVLEDFKDGRISMAMKRLAGMMVASALPAVLSVYTRALIGWGDDDEQALRKTLPDWQKNSLLIYSGIKDGEPSFFDATALFPSEVWLKPIMTAIGQRKDYDSALEQLSSGMDEFLSPYYDADLTVKMMSELYSNKNQYDQKIYESDNLFEAIFKDPTKVTNHIMKGAGPGVYNNISEFARANDIMPEFFGERITSYGREYTNEDALLALAGFRFSTINFYSSMLYMGYDLKDDAAKVRYDLAKKAKRKKAFNEEEIADIISDYNKGYSKVEKDLTNMINTARKLNMSEDKIQDAISTSFALSKSDYQFYLHTGKLPLKIISEKSYHDYLKKMGNVYKDERIKSDIKAFFEKNVEKINRSIRQENSKKMK